MAKKQYYATGKPYYTRRHIFPIYRICRGFLKLSVPTHKTIYECEPPDEPSVFCANHQRAYGPIVMLTKFDRKTRPWTIALLCYYKTAASFLISDCFPAQTPFGKFIAKLVSYMLVPVAVSIFRGAESVPVFYDSRMATTFKKSLQTLNEGIDITIFPEPSRHYLEYDQHFSMGFVNIARQYYKTTKKKLKFYPVYICQKKSIIVVGPPAEFNPEAEFASERDRIGNYILHMMMDMALYHEEGKTKGFYTPTLSKNL